jgi:hypothetical protein
MTFVGGPVVNKIGIKWACFIAAVTFPLSGAGYYVRAKFKVDWFLLFARALGGIGGGEWPSAYLQNRPNRRLPVRR